MSRALPVDLRVPRAVAGGATHREAAERVGVSAVSASRRRTITTTRRDPEHRPANDLVRRNFCAKKSNELWVADITFLPTFAGFLFLAVVMDAWSRVRHRT